MEVHFFIVEEKIWHGMVQRQGNVSLVLFIFSHAHQLPSSHMTLSRVSTGNQMSEVLQ